MAVPFINVRLTVGSLRLTSRQQLRRIQAQSHRSAHVAITRDHITLIGQGGDDRVGCGLVELQGVRSLETRHGAGEFDHHALQTQAQSQGRHTVLSGVGKCPEFAFDAPHPETAGNADAIEVGQVARCTLGRRTLVAGHPPQVHSAIVLEAARANGFGDGQVRAGKSMLPTKPIVTSLDGLCTRPSRSSQPVQSTSRNGRSRRRTTYASRPSLCRTFGMS